MDHLFVSFELASELKEKGFNEPCFSYYYNFGNNIFCNCNNLGEMKSHRNSGFLTYVSRPIHQQVVDWLREMHKIVITLGNEYNGVYTFINAYPVDLLHVDTEHCNGSTYYEAYNLALTQALKQIKS